MAFREVLARRQSVRSYNGTPVTDSEITALLEAANASPIGRGLYQNVHLSVVRSKPLLKQVAAIAGEAFGDPAMDPFYGASTLILASCVEAAATTVGLANSACMVENMHLAATNLGLASVYLYGFIHTIAKNDEIVRALGVPKGFVPVAALAVGHTDKTLAERPLVTDKIQTSFVD